MKIKAIWEVATIIWTFSRKKKWTTFSFADIFFSTRTILMLLDALERRDQWLSTTSKMFEVDSLSFENDPFKVGGVRTARTNLMFTKGLLRIPLQSRRRLCKGILNKSLVNIKICPSGSHAPNFEWVVLKAQWTNFENFICYGKPLISSLQRTQKHQNRTSRKKVILQQKICSFFFVKMQHSR